MLRRLAGDIDTVNIRSIVHLLGAILLALTACQVHRPQLGPNVELLDTERQQRDAFVALQEPLETPDDADARAACTREVEARATTQPQANQTTVAMDTAVRACIKKQREP